MKQHEAVILALERLGGQATLGELYREVMRIGDCRWGTKTPFASIRRIVQTRNEIFKIRPGLWALESHRREMGLGERPGRMPDREPLAQGHSYYQGVLLELGKTKGFETFCPNQDKNRLYVRTTLAETRTLRAVPPFTYEHLAAIASRIDVTWFNSRRFPQSMFEVEHSTDFRNSLVKFVEFQDFRAEMYVVADARMRRLFEQTLRAGAFVPVQDRVRFLDYDRLVRLNEDAAWAAAGDLVS
jgi:hypothetical protein